MKDNTKDNIVLPEFEGEYKINLSESDLEAISGAANLNEDDTNTLSTVFEAALNRKMKEYSDKCNEHYIQAAEKILQESSDKVGQYLDKIFNEWATEKEDQISESVKSELDSEIVSGMLDVLKESYVEVPDGRTDILDEMNNSIKELESENANLEDELEESQLELNGLKCEAIINELSEGLTDTDTLKFESLIEDLEINDIDKFRNKATIIKESYFKDSKDNDKDNKDNLDESNRDNKDKKLDEDRETGNPLDKSYGDHVLEIARRNIQNKG